MGKLIFPRITDVMRREARDMHISEIAHATGLLVDQVSSSINYHINDGGVDIIRVRRGIYRYVTPRRSRASEVKLQKAMGDAKLPVAPTEPAVPEVLEVLGITSKGALMARDPDTKQMYEARPM